MMDTILSKGSIEAIGKYKISDEEYERYKQIMEIKIKYTALIKAELNAIVSKYGDEAAMEILALYESKKEVKP